MQPISNLLFIVRSAGGSKSQIKTCFFSPSRQFLDNNGALRLKNQALIQTQYIHRWFESVYEIRWKPDLFEQTDGFLSVGCWYFGQQTTNLKVLQAARTSVHLENLPPSENTVSTPEASTAHQLQTGCDVMKSCRCVQGSPFSNVKMNSGYIRHHPDKSSKNSFKI